MALVRQHGQMDDLQPYSSKVVHLDQTADFTSDAYYLSADEQVVRVTTTADGNDITLYLPAVADAAGRIFTVSLESLGDNESVLVLEKNGDSESWEGGSGYDLDTEDDGICLFSDGMKWWVLTNDIA